MKRIKLGDLFKVQGGYAFKSKEVKDNGIPIIRIGNIKDNKVVVDDNYCYDTNFLSTEKNKVYIIQKGDLLIAMSGATTGKVGIYLNDTLSLLNQRVGKFVNLGMTDNSKYLYYILQSPKFKKMIVDKAVGCAQPNISNKDIELLDIPFHSDNERARIVNDFDIIYEMIDNRKKQIDDYKKLIINNFELNYNNMNKEEIGKLCSIKARIGWQGLTKKEYLDDGPCYLITGVDFKEDKIDFENCYYVTEDRYNQDENIQIHKGDVLVTKDGTIGKVAYIDEEPSKPTTLNSGVFVVRKKKEDLNSVFIEYSLMSNSFKKFIEEIKTGATISHLNQEAFVRFKIPDVDIKQQTEFASFVESVNSQIIMCQKDIKDLESIIENKMHEYFD